MYYKDQAEELRNMVKQQSENTSTDTTRQARILTVTSGKGGVGKSNTAVNLAIQFRRLGKRVIIFDADFGVANVEVMFGTVPTYSLKDVIYGDMQIADIITEGAMEIGFISGGSGIVELSDLTHEQVERVIDSLSDLNRLTDILIIDTGAGVGSNVMDFVVASPDVILVSTPEPSSLTDSYSLLKGLYNDSRFDREKTKVHLLANRVRSMDEADAIYEKLDSVVARFLDGNLSYLGVIPQDAYLENAVRKQKIVSLVSPSAKSSKAYEKAAARLLEVDYEQEKGHWTLTGFFRSLIRPRAEVAGI